MSIKQALKSLHENGGDWAIIGEWLIVRLPLGGSDKIIVAKIKQEIEVIKE